MIDIPGSSNFFGVDDGFLLQSPDSKVFFTKDGIINQTFLQSGTLIGVSRDGQSATAVVGTDNQRQLVALSLPKHSSKTIDDSLVGAPAWLDPHTTLYATTHTSPANAAAFSTYDMTTDRVTSWEFGKALLDSSSSLSIIDGLVGDRTAVVEDSNSNHYLIGTRLAAITATNTSYRRVVSVNSKAITVIYSSDDKAFLVSVTDPASLGATQAAVYALLRKDGYNPDLYNIEFNTYRTD